MIYIGNFLHTTNQQEEKEEERRHGEFHLVIQADSRREALDRFESRIQGFRESSSLFEGECRIFLVQVLELDEIPRQQPVMTHYQSIIGDPAMPYIGCANPSDQAEKCRIFNWKENKPEVDGQDSDLFMEFTS